MPGWLITGAGGLLGRETCARLADDGADFTALSHAQLDITDRPGVAAALGRIRPEVVVNCAAWTAVDRAEAESELAFRVNGDAVRHLAEACQASRSALVQVSTDYVFAGQARRPYSEADPPDPQTGYGRGKLAGEQAVRTVLPDTGYVLRTAWLYGAYGPNFVLTMMAMERKQHFIDVVCDQQGQPTWAADVAQQLVALVRSGAPAGIYHATSSGATTWFGLAQEVFRLAGAQPARVRPVTSAAMLRPAKRPAYSVLGHASWAAAGLAVIGPWQDRLRQAFPSLLAAAGQA